MYKSKKRKNQERRKGHLYESKRYACVSLILHLLCLEEDGETPEVEVIEVKDEGFILTRVLCSETGKLKRERD